MTKKQYLADLEKKLKPLPADERADALNYYAEYFEEAGPQNEQTVISRLGAPAYVAAQVISRSPQAQGKTPSVKKDFSLLFIILLGIISAPLTLPVLLVLLSVVLISIVVAGALLLALFAAAFGFLTYGFDDITLGAPLLFTSYGEALYNLGAGLLCFGLGGLAIVLAFVFLRFLTRAAIKIFSLTSKEK